MTLVCPTSIRLQGEPRYAGQAIPLFAAAARWGLVRFRAVGGWGGVVAADNPLIRGLDKTIKGGAQEPAGGLGVMWRLSRGLRTPRGHQLLRRQPAEANTAASFPAANVPAGTHAKTFSHGRTRRGPGGSSPRRPRAVSMTQAADTPATASTSTLPSWPSTRATLPGSRSPLRIISANGASIRRAMARRSGRAPSSGS